MLLLLWLAGCGGDKGIVITDPPAGGADSGVTTAPAASLVVSPESVDLGAVILGSIGTATVDVANTGDVAAVLETSLSGDAAWTVSLDSTIVAAGGVVSAVVTLTPTTFGSPAATLTLTDTEGGGTLTVPLTALVVDDQDGDGAGSIESGGDDCDDTNAEIFPGAEDIWYDGIDSDCAGNDDLDQDGDGTRVANDCDDTDATVYPGAPDAWYDGVDSDCAGNDDMDQDGDGVTVDLDCVDTDPAIYPGADDVWYDGVDTDCAGNDDLDQDGDGYVSAEYGGDDCDDLSAAAYPGAPETWYDGVDGDCLGGNDFDQDGDGVDWPDDCNDTDPSIIGPVAETLNGNDDDCDGVIDDLSARVAASTVLYGDSDNLSLGEAGSLALGGDLTGDGAPDLAATSSLGSSYAWVVASTVLGTSGAINDLETARVTGTSARPFLRLAGPLGDVTHDGVSDLVVGGYDSGDTDGEVWLFEGGGSMSGELTWSGHETASFTGDSDADTMKVAVMADIDGDGLDDLATGSPYDNYTSGWSSEDYAGNIGFFSGTLTGELSLSDADEQIHGSDNYDYLGDELTYGDLNGDGYADVIASAPGMDNGRTSDVGAVYVFAGNATIGWVDDQADSASLLRVAGDSRDTDLGEDPLPAPGDHDGDGQLDLVFGSTQEESVWLWYDGSSLSGTTDISTADATFVAGDDFGSAVGSASDLNGDGAAELVIGARGDSSAASNAGAVFVFGGGVWSGTINTDAAIATFYGVSADDELGSGVGTGADLDADGHDDLLIGAPGVDDEAINGGAIYVVRGW